MRTIFSKTLKIKLTTTVACVLAMAIAFFGVSTVFAVFVDEGGGAGGGDSGGDGGSYGGSCKQNIISHPGYQFDVCGAGFKLYDVNEPDSWPWITSKPTEIKNKIINEVAPICSELGGTFYMLALHRVSLDSSGNVVRSGQFAWLREVRKLTPINDGGSGGVPYVAEGGAIEFDKAKERFQQGKDYAQKRVNEHPELLSKYQLLLNMQWPDTNWFCWSPGMDNVPDTSGFSSKSKVSSGSKTSESPSWGQDATTLEVSVDDDEEAEVKFSHKLQYTKPTASGNYNDAFTKWTITITDGSNGTWTDTYSTSGGANAESSWLPIVNGIPTEIDVKVKAGDTVCSTISYTPKTVQWDNNDPKNETDTGTDGSTTACVKVTKSTTSSVGYIEFWSRSHVSSVAMNDVPYYKVSTFDNINGSPKQDGDEVKLYLSTDYSKAGANFSHDLNYIMSLNAGITYNSSNDTLDTTNMCTEWTIHSDETYSDGNNGKYCASAEAGFTGSNLDVNRINNPPARIIDNIDAKIAPEFPASEKITFTKKRVPIYRSEIQYKCATLTDPNKMCSYNPKHWKYYSNANTGSGEGSSTATIIYEPPPVPGGEGPSSGSQTNSNPFYAGEKGTMSWSVDTWPTKTRRVGLYETVAFLVPVSKSLDSNSTIGTRSQSDPCTFWRSKLGPLRDPGGGACKEVTLDPVLNQDFDRGSVFNYTSKQYDHYAVSFNYSNSDIAIPDWVGDKYCNSFGYKWFYWKLVHHTKPAPGWWEWVQYGTPYWTHYSAACRTIAKKPSVAFWNGGLFVGQGDVRTIISTRRQNPGVAVPAASLDPRQYGSWSEYLANVNGEVAGGVLAGAVPGAGGLLFSSGATYAWNGADKGNTALKNSPLTIQNSGTLGYSGVEANSAVLERLEAYFKKAAELKPGGCSVLNGETNINETKICYVNGSVAITGNITLNVDTKNSIYQIPQVVIFATDNINISEKVTQIDAWLISKGGKVDTCTNGSSSVFKSGETQARVDKSSNPINAPGYNTCQDKLIINGPVFAQSVTTKRSFGSDGVANTDSDPANAADTRAVPAEVFNLSAASYLWAYAQAGRYGSSYTEAYSRELPPRY